MTADLAAGAFIIRCEECHRIWVAHTKRPGDTFGRCYARRPVNGICQGWFRRVADDDETGQIVQAALVLGGWVAVVALITSNETAASWGWHQGREGLGA